MCSNQSSRGSSARSAAGIRADDPSTTVPNNRMASCRAGALSALNGDGSETSR